MGLDREYQAVPENWNLLALARDNPDLGEWVSFVPWTVRDFPTAASNGPPDPARELMLQAVRELLARDPGIQGRGCDLHRLYTMIRYLLSANYRGEPPTPADALFDIAIEGEHRIADHVRGTQGIPDRYTPAATVAKIAALMEPLTCEMLRPHYQPARMEATGVYKAHPEGSEEQWGYLCEGFLALRAMYIAAASHGEAVLVCTD